MKNKKLIPFSVLFAIVLIAFSCNKREITSSDLSSEDDNNEQKQNVATWITSNEGQSKAMGLQISFLIGHTAAQCGNSCVKIFGQLGHIDCRGFGYICNHIASVRLVDDGGVLKLVFDDPDDLGDDLDFLFPDRTLQITNPQNNKDFWLNIPEQLLLRNSNNIPFEILDIWFSEEPELENK